MKKNQNIPTPQEIHELNEYGSALTIKGLRQKIKNLNKFYPESEQAEEYIEMIEERIAEMKYENKP
jgi:ABC-type Fe3+-hydroxamate transport system substrate-binding protein